MDVRSIRRTSSWKLVAASALGIAAALLLSLWGGGGYRAQAALSGVDEAIAIDVGNNGSDDCDTRASTGGIGTTCTVSVGSMFTVKGAIDKVAIAKGTGGYIVFQFTFAYTSPGLTRNNRVEPAREVGNPTYWQVTPGNPAVCSPNTESEPTGPGSYYIDCWQTTKSTYTGKLVEVDFTCASAGTRTVTMQDAGTYVHDQNHGSAPDVDADEVLTINCSSGVGGIAEAPDVGGTPLQAGDSSGPNAGLLAGVIAGATAAAVALAGGAWYARRRWVR